MYMCVYRVETIVRGLNHDDVMFATLAIFQQQMISNKIKTTNLTHITKTTKLVRDLSDTCVIIYFRFLFSVSISLSSQYAMCHACSMTIAKLMRE